MAQWHPLGGSGGLPSNMVNTQDERYWRLEVQTLDVGQDFIINGIAFSLNWIERGITTAEMSRYAKFDVPEGFKLAIDYRLFNPSGDNMWYFVYPQGTYTLGAEIANTAQRFVKMLNLRDDSPLPFDGAKLTAVTTLPTRFVDSIIDLPQWGVASSSSGNKSEGGLSPDNTFLMLSGGQQFLLEIYNGGAGTANAQIELNFALGS